jgi:hypothetical protein
MVVRFKEFVEQGYNFSFTKFGDGEAICMSMNFKEGDSNCDYQSYSLQLSIKLIEAYLFFTLKENVFIGEWNFGDIYEDILKNILNRNNLKLQYAPYSTMLNVEGGRLDELKSLYETIGNSNKRKVYICPEKLNGAKSLLKCDVLNIPEREAFYQYEHIVTHLLNSDYEIFLYSAGLLSKVLISDIMKKNPNTTHIDIGSGLDNLFVGETRSSQVEYNELNKFYFP